MTYFNNRLYLSCAKQGLVGAYNPTTGFERVGSTSMGIQSMTAPPANSTDANKIYFGGYPTGGLLQYSPFENWTVNPASFNFNNANYATASSNPKQSALFQKADANGVNGSMNLLGIGYTKTGYIAGAGNNDRITVSSGRELSMGSYKNGSIRNLYLPEFSNYEFQSFSLSSDSNFAFVGAVPHDGNSNAGKIYKYDPVSNTVVKSWNITLWGNNYYSIRALDKDLLVGICADIIFLFDFNTGQIIWRQSVGNNMGIFSMAIAPDNSVYITHSATTDFQIDKFAFNTSNRSAITATKTVITELIDRDHNERSKPTGMILVPRGSSGSLDLYVSGLFSLYRVQI
jgi:hypothetical protein